MIDYINLFDSQAIIWIQENLRTPIISSIMIPFTKLGDAGLLFIIIALVMLFFKKTRVCGILMLISMFISTIFNDVIIKNIVQRQRPFNTFREIIPLVSPPGKYSFPSGHTACAFSCMSVLFFTHKKYAYTGLIIALIMGISRLYVGVHYPTDVLIGAAVGTITACIVGYIYTKRV